MTSSFKQRFIIERFLTKTAFRTSILCRDRLDPTKRVVVKVLRRKALAQNLWEHSEQLNWNQMITHPHLIRPNEVGLTPVGDLYVVRDYIEKEIEFSNTSWISDFVGTAVFLQRCGRTHGQIRPSNLALAFDGIVLMDPWVPGSRVTLDPETVHYLAPELIRGGTPNAESDLYAVGAVLYRAIAGVCPFSDSNVESLVSKYLYAKPKGLASVCSASKSLSNAIQLLLDKVPERRPLGLKALTDLFPFASVTTTAPLFGRSAELQLAIKVCARARETGLHVLALSGVAGIGKTRFVSEIDARAGLFGFDFARNSLPSTPRSLARMTYELAKTRERAGGGSVKNQLGDLFEPLLRLSGLGTVTRQHDKIHETSIVAGALATLGQRKPLIVAIDPADGSLDFTELVMRHLGFLRSMAPVVFLLALESERALQRLRCFAGSTLPGRITSITLSHLDSVDTGALCKFFEGSVELSRVAMQQSCGNPLLAETYLLGERKRQKRLDSIFRTLVRNLDHDSRYMLEVLSALGSNVTIPLLQKVTDQQEVSASKLQFLLDTSILRTESNIVRIRYPELSSWISKRVPASQQKLLHQRAFRILREVSQADMRTLADHAYYGGFYSDALPLYVNLMRAYRTESNLKAAITSYERARKISLHLKMELTFEDELNIAKCYTSIPRPVAAKNIYRRLLSTRNSDPTDIFTAQAYVGLAAGELCGSVAQIDYYRQAVAVLPQDCEEYFVVSARLGQALSQKGAIREAQELLSALWPPTPALSTRAVALVCIFKSSLHLFKGEFRQAIHVLRQLKAPSLTLQCGALCNMATCLDEVGAMRNAVATQSVALDLAQQTGFILAEIVCLANLGSFFTKLGRFSLATEHFDRVDARIRGDEKAQSTFWLKQTTFALADKARLKLEMGAYDDALSLVGRARALDNRIERDRIWVEVAAAEILLRLNDEDGHTSLSSRFARSEVFATPFFQVESGLLMSSRMPTENRIAELHRIRQIAETTDVPYQTSRIWLQLTRAYLTAQDWPAAAIAVKHAIRLSRRRGYRVIFAWAVLLRAFVSQRLNERRDMLRAALEQAERIGLPELTAEASYNLGVVEMQTGEIVRSHEYFAKSTGITKRLAENVPRRYVKRYLAETWRQDARAKLQECSDKIISAAARIDAQTHSFRDDRFVKSLYKLSLAMSSATTYHEFIDTVADALDETLRQPAFISFDHAGTVSWKSTRVKATDEMRVRLGAVAERFQNKSYFGASGENNRSTTAWIPFQSEEIKGGLFVECGKSNRLTEQEIDYLTVVGTIANAAFDRIHDKPVPIQRSQPVSEFHGLVGSSRPMKQVYEHIEVAARNTATVLIEGESGTGKELVARAIHECSARAKGPFIPLDCGAIAESLIESELFGSRKGSYTGSIADRPGMFEAAHGGTIFLDEISNTSAGLQAKLLRVIQEREVRRIGETKGRTVDVRVIVATNTSLEALVQQRLFRQDLLYRLKVLHVRVPPLRNRREDIPLLAEHFVDKLNVAQHLKKYATPKFIENLGTLSYPGNVRELQNVVERSYLFAKGAAIIAVAADQSASSPAAGIDEIQRWFKELSEGRKDFWAEIHEPYKRRDISREKIVALIDLGLRTTRGNYKTMASLFKLKDKDYRRFMDFLRRGDCLLDFRPYRKMAQ